MRLRKLTASGDYSFGHGLNDLLIDSPAAVGQLVETTLRLFQGEWYLDLSAGTPYVQGILGKHSKDLADASFIGTITNVQGVVSLVDYVGTINPQTRQYSASGGKINTIYGQTELDVQNETDL